MRTVHQILIIILFLVAGSIVAVAADDASVSGTSAAVPDDFSAPVQEALKEQGYELQVGGTPIANFWFSQELTFAESASNELGVSFGKLQPGSFVGIVELLEPWRDYKDSSIPAGSYTLRYGVQPADGNHMGVSYYRDFLLLSPAGQDADPDGVYSYGELVALGTQAAGTPHPAVMALFPLYEEVTELKLVKNDLDQWTIAVPFDSVTLGVVVQGHGEI